jgi:hypothetical protein
MVIISRRSLPAHGGAGQVAVVRDEDPESAFILDINILILTH